MSAVESGGSQEDDAVPVAEGPPTGGPLHYLREATKIARFDGEAIARVSRDRQALVYGAGIVAIGALAAYLWRPASGPVGGSPGVAALSGIAGAAALILVQLISSALQVAVIHGAAKLLFDATSPRGWRTISITSGRYRACWPANIRMRSGPGAPI